MFIANVYGQEVVNDKAASIGCTAGLCGYGWGAKPGLTGNTFGIKEQLKAGGARWDGQNKAWAFADWTALEVALNSVIAA